MFTRNDPLMQYDTSMFPSTTKNFQPHATGFFHQRMRSTRHMLKPRYRKTHDGRTLGDQLSITDLNHSYESMMVTTSGGDFDSYKNTYKRTLPRNLHMTKTIDAAPPNRLAHYNRGKLVSFNRETKFNSPELVSRTSKRRYLDEMKLPQFSTTTDQCFFSVHDSQPTLCSSPLNQRSIVNHNQIT